MVSQAVLEKSFARVKDADINLLVNFFGNQNKLAIVLGVDRARITRWQNGRNPDELNNEKIIGLVYLLRLLLNNYYPETAMNWLLGNNTFLGNSRPLDLIRENRITDVIKAVRQDIAGSYA